jgi:hypothetical protein
VSVNLREAAKAKIARNEQRFPVSAAEEID